MAEKREIAQNADNFAAAARKVAARGPATTKASLAVMCAGDGRGITGGQKTVNSEGLGVFVSAAADVTKGTWQEGKPEGLAVTISEAVV
jgi:hypothetical protein